MTVPERTSIAESNAPVPMNIERIVAKRGLFKSYVAKKAGLTPANLSDILGGRRVVRMSEVADIARALDVEISELFVENPEEEESE